MKTKALFLVLTVIFLLACGVSSEQLTATAVVAKAQTETAAPTRTATQTVTPTATSTPTPRPTQTPTPVPAAVGETIKYNDLEITLLKVLTHPQVIVHSYYYYDAKEGYIFIDVIARVRNPEDGFTSATMGEIYVVDQEGQAWMPFYGAFQTVELEKSFDPMTIIKWDMIVGDERVTFESKKDIYLRLIWPVKVKQDLLFGIKDSPQFAFSVK